MHLATIFNPDESARILKIKITSRTKLTGEIVSELYKARDFYSASGSRSDLVPVGTRLSTFEAYLADVGLARRTAYNWLERYVPEENKLLTYEELTEKKTIEAQDKKAKENRERSMIAEYRRTGTKPAGWDRSLDYRMKADDDEAKQQERLEKYKQEQNQKSADEKKRREAFMNTTKTETPDDVDHYYRLGKAFEEGLKTASTTLHTKHTDRQSWKEKIRLSAGGKEDAFMDAIIDYMDTLQDDNRRIEACNNIIKICRNIAVELQQKGRPS